MAENLVPNKNKYNRKRADTPDQALIPTPGIIRLRRKNSRREEKAVKKHSKYFAATIIE